MTVCMCHKNVTETQLNLPASSVLKEKFALPSPISTVSANTTTQYGMNGLRFVIFTDISIVEIFDNNSPLLPVSDTI